MVVSLNQGFLTKLDLSKAYDRVDQSFLFKILKSFSSGNKCIQLIYQLVLTTSLTIMFNGSSSDFFTPTRRLRQVDPIPPILFIIMVECRGRYIKHLNVQGSIHSLYPSSFSNSRSHEQFMDGTILIWLTTVTEAGSYKNALNICIQASGQLINWEKSFLFFVNTPLERQNKMSRILGCGIAALPRLNLGLPLWSKLPDSFWEILIDKHNKKLVRWKGNLLSQVGKIVLLKHCLQILSIYALSLSKMLIKYVDAMERIRRNFSWSRTENKKRLSLITWESICKPKNLGGLGIRPIRDMNKPSQLNKVGEFSMKTRIRVKSRRVNIFSNLPL